MKLKPLLIGLTFSIVAMMGCVQAASLPATPTPIVTSTVAAPTSLPTDIPEPTPDIQATVAAIPTATPTLVPTPTPTLVPEPTAPTTGKWSVGTVVDPLDDSVSTIAILVADEGEDYIGRKFRLAIGCYKGDIDVHLSTHSFFADDYATVTVRLDENPAFSERWQVSGDSNLWAPDGNVLFFINSLTRSQGLIMRVSPYRDPSITAIFDLSGSQAALQQVLDACD